MADNGFDLPSFLLGHLSGARHARRVSQRDDAAPSAIERGTAALLRRMVSPRARRAHARAKANDKAARLAQRRAEIERRHLDAERRREASATHMRAAGRHIVRATLLGFALIGALFVLSVLALALIDKPASPAHGTVTIRQRY